MQIIQPSFEILTPFSREDVLKQLQLIEAGGRVCYKSEGSISCDSASPFVRKIANVFKHESVIEHSIVSVRFICDRGITHEMVRHRLASYSQESTRYCNYAKDGFGNSVTFIEPPPAFFQDKAGEPVPELYRLWHTAMQAAETAYLELLKAGATPQQARNVLPNSLKTEIIMSCNFREWRHVFRMRTSDKAHPQMQQIMVPLLARFAEVCPELFSDLT